MRCHSATRVCVLEEQAGMGLIINLSLLIIAIFVVFIGLRIQSLSDDAPVPVLDKDHWWGPGEKRVEDDTIRGFKIQVSDQVINDLNSRLDRFLEKSLTPPLENIAFEYGYNTNHIKTVISHWRKQYNWRQREKFLNSMPQFSTRVNGLKIHYIRVTPIKTEGRRVLPLLMLHGWPGSIREFYEIIPLLVQPHPDRDFIFEVIAPSLPGYGFSEAPSKPGMGPVEVAVIMNNLMNKIGFQKYYVQGGDWGALIAKNIGTLYPRNVIGVHSNMCSVNTPWSNIITLIGTYLPGLVVDKHQQHLLYPFGKKISYLLEETGYFHIQATKPDTIGTVLSDTPAGLAAYILEKFSTWTNPSFKSLPDGGLTKKYHFDHLLDNIMIYWVTNSITTSQRLYSEAFTFKEMAFKMDEVPLLVPSACARMHHDLVWQPETLLKLKFRNLVHVSDFPDTGHFPAFENPQGLAEDIFIGIGKMEKLRKPKLQQ